MVCVRLKWILFLRFAVYVLFSVSLWSEMYCVDGLKWITFCVKAYFKHAMHRTMNMRKSFSRRGCIELGVCFEKGLIFILVRKITKKKVQTKPFFCKNCMNWFFSGKKFKLLKTSISLRQSLNSFWFACWSKNISVYNATYFFNLLY